MEEWQKFKKKEGSQPGSSQMEDKRSKELGELEIANEEDHLRQESKRKGNVLDGRKKPKRMKFARLVHLCENEGSTPSS